MKTGLVNGGFLLACCLLAAIGLLSWQQSQRLAAANDWVIHTHEVIGVLETLMSDLKDAETGQRGFLVTGDPVFLEPYQHALTQVSRDIATVNQLTLDNPQQQENLKTLQPLIQARMARLSLGISIRREQGQLASQKLAALRVGKKLMDAVRRQVDDMVRVESNLLTQRNETARRAAATTNQVILVGYLLSLCALGWGFISFRRQALARLLAEAAQRKTESRLSLLVNSVQDYGIIMLDPGGHVMSWNDGAKRLIGYSADEIVGRHFSAFYPEDARAAGSPQQVLATARHDGIYHEEGWRIRKDGTRFWAHVTLTAIRDVQGQLEGFAKITRDVAERKNAVDALQRLNETLEHRVQDRTAALQHEVEMRRAGEAALRELTMHLESVREAERSRIAREIHDDLGSTLTALKMETQACVIQQGAAASETAIARLKLIDDAIQSLRRIINDLRPAILDHLGLWAALEWQTAEFRERLQIDAAFEMDGEEFPVEAGRATALFRLYQEALTNIARHAGATRVRAVASIQDGMILLRVEDNGIGIDERHLLNTQSFGIRGMHERVRPFNGVVRISAAPKQGTTIMVAVPIPEAA